MKKLLLLIAILFSTLTVKAYDWEHVSLSGGVETFTEYHWRGTNSETPVLQPYVEFSTYGFNLGAWFSLGVGYDTTNIIVDNTTITTVNNLLIPEMDLYLSYTSPDGHFTLGLTHYYYFDGPFFGGGYERDNLGSSQSEISVSVFGHEEYPLEIGFNMMFGGGDYESANGYTIWLDKTETKAKKLFSTYLYVKYTFELENLSITPELGLSPAPSMYTYYYERTGKHLGSAMNNIACNVSYTFLESDYVCLYAVGNVFFNLFDVGYEPFEYGKNCGVSFGVGIEL